MIEIGKLAILAIIGGLLIMAVAAFVAMPSLIARSAIENVPATQYGFWHQSLQAGLLIAVAAYVAQTIIKVVFD